MFVPFSKIMETNDVSFVYGWNAKTEAFIHLLDIETIENRLTAFVFVQKTAELLKLVLYQKLTFQSNLQLFLSFISRAFLFFYRLPIEILSPKSRLPSQLFKNDKQY